MKTHVSLIMVFALGLVLAPAVLGAGAAQAAGDQSRVVFYVA